MSNVVYICVRSQDSSATKPLLVTQYEKKVKMFQAGARAVFSEVIVHECEIDEVTV